MRFFSTRANYLLLQLATNALAAVTTAGSGPQGNAEEFAGSDGDERWMILAGVSGDIGLNVNILVKHH